MAREDIIEDVKRIYDKYDSVMRTLKVNPYIASVGIGAQVLGDVVTETIGFIAYIMYDHFAALLIDPDKDIPLQIEDEWVFVVYVQDYDMARNATINAAFQTYSDMVRPLVGGLQIKNITKSGSGTLGCFATYDNPGEPHHGKTVLLSNRHVLYPKGYVDWGDLGVFSSGSEKGTGAKIAQPQFISNTCMCCPDGTIATNIGFGDTTDDYVTVDAAIAVLNTFTGFEDELRPIPGSTRSTKLNGLAKPLWEGSKLRVAPGDIVYKTGMRTGLTQGTVVDVFFQSYNDKLEADQSDPESYILWESILIKPKTGDLCFAYEGDSGSVIVNEANEIVGLLYAFESNYNGMASHIQNVMDTLHITIPESTTVVPTSLKMASPIRLRRAPSGVDPLTETISALKSTMVGAAFVDAWTQHLPEIQRLLKTQRLVRRSWIEQRGPRFVVGLRQALGQHRKAFVKVIDGRRLEGAVLTMLAILQQHGSNGLREALRSWAPLMLRIAGSAKNIKELIQILQHHTA
jgi:hypothetical protein